MVASPWGPIRVSDAHVHFFSHRFFTLLAAQKPGLTFESMEASLGWQMPPADPSGWRGSGLRNSTATALSGPR